MYFHENEFEFQNFIRIIKEREKIVAYKREEELYRKCGVNKNLQIEDFGYFNTEYNNNFLKAFNLMQDKYIFKNEYRKTIEEINETLKEIKEKLSKLYN